MLPTTIIYFPVKLIKPLSARNIYFAVAWMWTILTAFLCLFSLNKIPSFVTIGGNDKYGHVLLHFGFTILWFLYFNSKKPIQQLVFKIVITSLVYGVLIEIAQGLFTTTRKADIFDVVANATGAIMAAAAIYFYSRSQKHRFYN